MQERRSEQCRGNHKATNLLNNNSESTLEIVNQNPENPEHIGAPSTAYVEA